MRECKFCFIVPIKIFNVLSHHCPLQCVLAPSAGRSRRSQSARFMWSFGAWRNCLLRQALGARQAGAGGGPCHTSYAQRILCRRLASLAQFILLHRCILVRISELSVAFRYVASHRYVRSRSSTFHYIIFCGIQAGALAEKRRSFCMFFGAWRKCLLRQALGARQAGAGGGPCHRRNEKLILFEFAAQKDLFHHTAFR